MLASGAILGVVVGLIVGRDWRRLASVHLRWLPLLFIAVAARGVAPFMPGLAFVVYLFAITSTTVVAAANIRLFGSALICVGGAMNLAVVLLNVGMPVDPVAVTAAGAAMPVDALHVVLSDTTRFSALADVIAVPIVRSVYSVGDFCIAGGGFLVPFALLVRR